MKAFRLIWILLLVCGSVFTVVMVNPRSHHPESPQLQIKEWSLRWTYGSQPFSQPPPVDESWTSSTAEHPLTKLPSGANGAWLHVSIPSTAKWLHPGLLIDRLYGLKITVYEGTEPVSQTVRDYDFERNILLLPISANTDGLDLYLHIESKERAGVGSIIRLGEYNELSNRFVRGELPNVILGSSITFLALMMLVCSGYLHRNQRGPSIALCLFALSTGTLMVTYSSLPYLYFDDYGRLLVFLFDTSMYVLFPSFLYYVARIFEGSPGFITKYKRYICGYYVFCFIVMVLYRFVGDSFYMFYKLFTFWLLAPLILLQLVQTVWLSFRGALRGNRNSVILSAGMVLLALSGIADLVLFTLSKGQHLMSIWKLGVVFLIASLVMILNRRISEDYSRLLSYSKELEMYNYQLQRTEKMEIISELAASIAHEVRNPMQVTRGFLQLLSARTNEETKAHFSMAINELDRASAIITDFLTFAKPEMDVIAPMNLQQELSKIEMIMGPLAKMHGGVMQFQVPEHLQIVGNPSKFKQAFINMIKNSIESLREDGKIEVEAYVEEQTVIIRVTDNGEGMDAEQLAKLGEPYFSTKTKGTGLGLMVTFRIIEAMKGKLEYRSEKGKGTEAIVRFPLWMESGTVSSTRMQE